MADDKAQDGFVECVDPRTNLKPEPRITGTVNLIEDGEIILIPRPTADPQDPLNLPEWHKWLILIIVALYAMTGNLLASGIGILIPQLNEVYNNDPHVDDLVTWPAFYMGLGNLIAMPIADAIGRRPVYLLSNVILIIGSIWCSYSNSLGSHIGGRDFMALAAGQSEALCVLIAEETFFMHQRGNRIAWFCSLQTLGTALFIIASSYISNSIGWRWWYGIFAIITGFTFVLSILFVVETKYDRPLDSFFGGSDDSAEGKVTASQRRNLDFVNFKARSFWNDLKPWGAVKPQWKEIPKFWYHLGQLTLFPAVLWLVLCSGALLGTYILMTAVFAQVLMAPPYSFNPNYLGFVMGGQAVVAFVVQPIAGYGSDIALKYLTTRNKGVSEPEYRLIPAILPAAVAIVSCVIYGRSCEYPADWAWTGVVIPMNALFYSFVSVVVLGFVYTMDCYPQRGHIAMVALCAGRGFISFGISFGTTAFVRVSGYDGALDICAIVLGVLTSFGFVTYFFGKSFRKFTQRWAVDE
ncbi:MFS general substrate transporter [Penicillium cataractarum]|uniref:MFS general substrate transporter n=1 Tax=Penicillium cataractarum TaxID=2100454 RepID=A0A9W9V019_9EURO|nr:MFS general substrate transporter [Penicillium cataractarum]KAJ5363863.1 MFS general substrate transporter [Penicillium cataractarum]